MKTGTFTHSDMRSLLNTARANLAVALAAGDTAAAERAAAHILHWTRRLGA